MGDLAIGMGWAVALAVLGLVILTLSTRQRPAALTTR
jgi:hypothetical protein